MIKRLLLSLLVIFTSVQLNAQEPTALWGKAVQGAGVSMGSDIVMTSDGNIVIAGDAGTKTVDDVILFGNDAIAAPATAYKGNGDNSNGNLIITKVSQDGTPLWTVFSKYGEATSGRTYLQSVSDGVIAFVAIRHAQKYGGSSVTLVDAALQETSLNWMLPGGDEDTKRYYIGLIIKISQEGTIQWMRTIKPTDTANSEAFTPSGIVADESGGLWIGGTLKKEISLSKSGGDEVKVAPQTGSDDLLLVQLSPDGYYQQHALMEGAQKASVLDMSYADGKLYISGMLTGTAGSAVTLKGKSFTMENAFTTLYVAELNNEFTADFFQPFTALDKNFTTNIANLYVGSNHLWVLGKVQGNIKTIGEKLLSSENWTRVGMLLKMDKTTGNLLDGYVMGYGEQGVGTNQGGFFAAFEDTNGALYAAEHRLNDRMSIHKFSQDDLSAPVSSWDKMISYTGNVHDLVYTADGKLFTLTRSTKGETNPNLLYGGSVSVVQSSTAFSCNLCAFQLPITPVTGIQTLKYESPIDGIYYNLSGQRVERPTKGLYIHYGKKVVIK
jgi:hypothetical protein